MSGAAMGIIYAMGLGDLYEDEPEWSKIHNIYLPIVVTDNGKKRLVKIPSPYGLNFFPYVGQKAASYINNPSDYNLKEVNSGIIQSMEEIVNPFGGTLSPTAVRPFVDIMNNENFMDLPIHYEDVYTNMDVVLSEAGYSRTDDFYKEMARGVNKVSGGTKNEKGSWDWAPEDYKHVLEGYGGGLFKMAQNVYGMAQEREDADIPVARRFLSTGKENAGRRNFYKMYKEAGGRIFSEEEFGLFKENFNRAIEESPADADRIEQMYTLAFKVQMEKIMAEKVDKERGEFTGKAKEKAINYDLKKKLRKK
jgi:hypothetical protein